MRENIATSIVKNTTVMMGSQAITMLSSFILVLFLPRYLGTEEFGRLYLAMSITMIFHILIEFGGSFFIAKEVARAKDTASEMVMNSIGLRTLLWIGSLVVMAIFVTVAGYSPEIKMLIFILAVSKVWEVAEKVFLSCFQGFEVMQYSSICNIAERVFLMVAGITALLLGAKAITMAIVMAASTLISFFISLRYGKRLISLTPRWNLAIMKNLLHFGLPYFLYAIFGVIYYRIDAVMLSFWTPEAVLGWYGAAYRFFDVFMFFPSVFITAVFPVLSRLWVKETTTLTRTTQKSLELMILAGIPLSVLIVTFSREIIGFFFDFRQFAPSVVVLEIFGLGILLVYIDMMLGTALFASDKQRQWSWVAFYAIFVNVLLNFFLIPYFQRRSGNGGIGAALATLITELFVMGGALVLLPDEIFKGTSITVQLKGLAAGALMVLGLLGAGQAHFPWMVRGAIGLFLYAAALIGLRVLNPAEQIFLKNFFTVRNLRTTFVLNKQPQL